MFFDSHCHIDRIDLTQFENSFDVLMQKIAEQEVTEMVCISVNLEDYEKMQALIKPYPNIYASVGVHPDYEDAKEPDVDILVNLSKDKNIVAIGETGLDYIQPSEYEWQRDRFRVHIEAAKQAKLPLIVHTREAQKDTIDILKQHQAADVGGVLHCFTEDWAMAKQAIELNFYISISGIVTFKQAKNVHEMAKQIPDDRLLIETDAPWLAPVPYRGKTNHPGLVPYVAQHLANLRGTSVEHIAEVSRYNAQQLFKLKSS
ncbi:MAG: TatD family hydrolase [Gammaproteobacteria bacterium]|nr:TatD family hydrolase [Gammaproteobacteria bacterium]